MKITKRTNGQKSLLLSDDAGKIKKGHLELDVVTKSGGSADKGKTPALNDSGKIDTTMLNTASTTAGSSDSGKVVALGSDGLIDPTMIRMVDNNTIMNVTAVEAMAAGDFVYLFEETGVLKARRASTTLLSGLRMVAYGFIKDAVALNGKVSVYVNGLNNKLNGLTPGTVYYLSSTAGKATASPGILNFKQELGIAITSTSLVYNYKGINLL